ncbi:MAG: RrF2 family transcriptional regulator [Bilifractor sp.]|jgi:Rrf2 family protein
MKYTKSTDYALHVVAYIIEAEDEGNISVQKLASKMDASTTFLSKILTQLTKAGIIRSTSGKNGGYCLQKKKEDISFLDVIKAVEGSGYMHTPPVCRSESCRIQDIMREAEGKMLAYLESRKIYEVFS